MNKVAVTINAESINKIDEASVENLALIFSMSERWGVCRNCCRLKQ
ncbi:hypothetical protein C8D90_102492 [Enterobacillus tribolii]|uniref:Uncharacterized protein n=1 Tax=Enterobacillus tribolii TaxID=1487935 RepID=A0A370R293_9GAMM|nr:hypothetical protein C8D90_102492 [Enterobacillus tribolii]